MSERTTSIEDYKSSREQKSKELLEVILTTQSPDEKENAIQSLEAQFESIESMDDSSINEILSNVDNQTRERLVQKIVDSAGLQGDFYIKDSSEKWLKIALDTDPIVQDPTHGWVIRYKMVGHEITDAKTGKKTMEDVQGDAKNAVRKNFISSFVKFKKASPQFSLPAQKAA